MSSKDNKQPRETTAVSFDQVRNSGVPWPYCVSGFLEDIEKTSTRRTYFRQLQKWLPMIQSHDLSLIESWELLQIRQAILENGLGKDDHRQALAAVRGFFLHQGEQSRFQNLPSNYIEEVFGSDREYLRRRRVRLFGPDAPETAFEE